MQIEAIYENGKLEFSQPIQLKHSRVRLVVEIPDEEIATSKTDAVRKEMASYVLPPEAQALAEQMEVELDRIRNASLPPDDELPALSEKQKSRIAAFALREDR